MKMTMTTDYQQSYPYQRRQGNYIVLCRTAAMVMAVLVVGHQLQTTTAFMFLPSSQYRTLSMTNDIKNINANTKKKKTTMIEKKKDRIDIDNKETNAMTASTVVATKQQITAEVSTAPATVETEEDGNTNLIYNWMVTLLQEKGVVATFVNETSLPVQIGIIVVSVSLTYAAITLLFTTMLAVVTGWFQTAGSDVSQVTTVGFPAMLIHLWVSLWEILKVGIPLLVQAGLKVYAIVAPVVVETVTKGVEIASPILQETATKMTAAVAPYVDQMATNLVVPLQETVHDVTQAATNGVTEAVQGQTESIEAQLQDTAHAVNGAAEAKLHSATQAIDGFFFPEGSNNN